jgi:hypothetical protein
MYCPAVLPGDSAVMFVNCDMGGFYRSGDGGYTWALVDGHVLTGGDRCRVAFYPGDERALSQPVSAYMYAPYRGLLRSQDKGVTWSVVLTPLQLAQGVPLWGTGPTSIRAIAIDPADPVNRMYIGTNAGAFFTANAGAVWTKCSNVDGDVIDFVVLREPGAASTSYVYVCATSKGIYSSTGGTAWTDISGVLPAAPAGQYRVRGLAGARNDQQLALFVTIPTVIDGTPTWVRGGVWSSVKPAGGALSAWSEAMGTGAGGALPKAPSGTVCDRAEYEFLAMAKHDPRTVYVAVCGTREPPNPDSGVYKSIDQGATWQQVYNGYQQAGSNVLGGWADLDLGWSFGGPAQLPSDFNPDQPLRAGGFTVSATDANVAIYTNKAQLHITRTGGAPDASLPQARAWRQGYTRQWPGQGGPAVKQRWFSAGLEVTTVWEYAIRKLRTLGPPMHYICYTDIGHARSTGAASDELAPSDELGVSWTHTPPAERRAGPPRRYPNVYQLAFDPADPNRVWAAAADQHDIPYRDQLVVRGTGGVARSDDRGLTWTDWSGAGLTGLPSAVPALAKVGTNSNPHGLPGPVTSIVMDWANGRLWVAVFGSGVWCSSNASSAASKGDVVWQDQTSNLPAANRNVIRLQLDAAGLPYCLITACRNVQTLPNGDKRQTTFKHGAGERTGIWHLSSLSGPWQAVTPDPFVDSQGSPQDLWYGTDFVVSPINPQVLFLSTGFVERGNNGTGTTTAIDGKVYRSSDGGAHWDPVLSLGPQSAANPSGWLPTAYRDFAHVAALTQDPERRQTIYAGTRTHGLWISNNDGSSWSEFWPPLPFMSIHRVTFDWETRPAKPPPAVLWLQKKGALLTIRWPRRLWPPQPLGFRQRAWPPPAPPAYLRRRVMYIATYGSGVLKFTPWWWEQTVWEWLAAALRWVRSVLSLR